MIFALNEYEATISRQGKEPRKTQVGRIQATSEDYL